jgi:hypothetical protein
MDQVVEIFIQIIMAYFQIVMIVFGIFFFVFGVSTFFSVSHRKKTNRHWLTATVSAIREGHGPVDPDTQARGKVYYPVFEAVGQDGQMHQYECTSGSYNLNKFKVGARYQVELDSAQENFVLIKGDDKKDLFIGVFLTSMGTVMFGLSVLFTSFSPLTFAVWVVTAILMAFKFSKYIKPKALRQTIALFKARRARERLQQHQSNNPEVSVEYIQAKSEEFQKIGAGMSKISLLAGFVILCLGGAGYNAQLKFIDQAVLVPAGPCGLELGEDCRRTILYQDALSILPLKLRPVMDGVYHSKYASEKIIVSYGRWTPMPYFIVMALGALIILGALRRPSQIK